MTITPSIEDLFEDDYKVMAGGTEWYDDIYTYTGKSLEMDLMRTEDRKTILGDNWDKLIKLAEPNASWIDDHRRPVYDIDFYNNYSSIFCGCRNDWVLNGFRVFVGGIELYYVNTVEGDSSLEIIGANDLWLKFTAPRSRLGFEPTYEVRILHDKDGNHQKTEVIEDLGYIRYEREFQLKDSTKKTDRFHTGNQYMEVTTYAGF